MAENSQNEKALKKKGAAQYLGISLIVFGIVFNPWLLEWLFPSYIGDSLKASNKILIGFFQIVFLFFGFLFYRSRTSKDVKRAYFSVVLLFLMILFVEGTLHLVSWFVPFASLNNPNQMKPIYLLPYYQDQEWARQFTEELTAYGKSIEFAPYVNVTRKNFHGMHINVNEDACRKTWNPSSPPEPNSIVIFMFGGSALFGYGSRDERTIPSVFSQLINQNPSGRYYVYNYGQFGYTIQQEIVKLLLLLREGKRPDYVIFYDGVNEVTQAYHTRKAGSTKEEEQIRQKVAYRYPSPLEHFLIGIEEGFYKYSAIGSLLQEITRRIDNAVTSDFPKDETAAREFAEQIAENYLKSYSLLDCLSVGFGFQYLCIWQPVIFTEGPLIEKDSDFRDPVNLKNEKRKMLYLYTYELMRQKKLKNFVDLSGSLSDRKEPLFIDLCHLNENGDKQMAQKIYTVFKEKFLQ